MGELVNKSRRSKILKLMRKFHKWPGILLSIFLFLFALSGIILNHRDVISSVDIPRKYLPSEYKINNWNLASVKGAVHISPDDLVIFGNIGAWLTDNNLSSFIDFNNGFSKGIDNRKIESMLLTSEGRLLAGTPFGLYEYGGEIWTEIDLPTKEKRIVEIIEHKDEILILTRSDLIKTKDLENFSEIYLPPPVGYDNKVSLFKTLWTLHSGEMFGKYGKLVIDLFAVTLIFLSITGLLHWLFPKWIKKRRQKNKPRAKLIKYMLSNLSLHNKVGYISIIFLLYTAITGMFLRPPMLIAIAHSKVSKIPYTKMDTSNAWSDNLRRIVWDDDFEKFLVSTTDGFFLFDESFENEALPVAAQPPVSVMGCTVLEKLDGLPSFYMVGSFNGLFLWDIASGKVFDYLSGVPHNVNIKITMPISPNLVSGYIDTNENMFLFDYSHGIRALTPIDSLPLMPQGIINQTPISLWNMALEVHTGRIFSNIVGDFYVLYVPLIGLSLIIVLISGFVIWWKVYKKKRKNHSITN